MRIWDDPAIRDGLSWYLDVAENRRPAKFRIAATVATPLDPAGSSEDALWAELDRLTPIFLARRQAIRAGAPLPPAATHAELDASWRRARELGLAFESTTFERRAGITAPAAEQF
jgi:hypothetical protein